MGAFGPTLGTYRIEKDKSPTQIVGYWRRHWIKWTLSPTLAVFGNAEPDFNLSFTNNVTWKSFELNVMMHWKKGGDNINLSSLLSDFGGTTHDYDERGLDPKGQLSNGDYRIASFNNTARPFVEDASYFRVREIGLELRITKRMV